MRVFEQLATARAHGSAVLLIAGHRPVARAGTVGELDQLAFGSLAAGAASTPWTARATAGSLGGGSSSPATSGAAAPGARLGFDDIGQGEPALLLLTGWCSSRARWARVVPRLAENRRVINFEWRGHGDSAPADEEFGTSELVEDALEVIEATGIDTFIPCSASHSGWVAIELRRRLRGRVPAIVHLDWMVAEPSPPYLELIGELQSAQRWPQARDKLFEIWRAGEERPEIQQALEVMRRQDGAMWMRSGREIERSYRRHQSPLRALSRLDPPPRVLHLYGQPPALDYLEGQQEFARTHDWFRVRRVGARTHFSMLEAPGEVAAAIEEHARG